MTVKAGETLVIPINFSGSPVPTTIWTHAGDDVTPNDRTKVNVNPQEVNLTVPNVTLADGGLYTCQLKNDLGSDKVSINVIVLDKPSQPQGPLEASDIKTDGCTLTWKPPKETGNSPITNYVVEKLDPKKGEWQKVTSYCRSPQYEVIGLDEGKPYKFRVMAENAEGKSIPLETETTVTPKNPCTAPSAPTGLRISDQTSDSVSLDWNPVQAEGINKINGYQVEMCEPGSDEWYPVEVGLTRGTHLDVTGLRPNKDYKFRVKAKNAAGWGPSSKEDLECTLKPEFVKPDAPGIPNVKKIGSKHVELEWTPPVRDGGSKITGYIVEKKQAGTDYWVKTSPYNHFEPECRVDDLIENCVYEFRVKAVNKAGESEPSSTSGGHKITEYPNGVKPEFTKKLVDIEAPINGDATFIVDFEGNPEPTATWYKNGFEVIDGKRYEIRNTSFSSTLVIKKLYENENVTVSCTINNPLGKDSCESYLKVKQAPKLDKDPGNQTVAVGETLKVKIPITGKGPFSFKLKKDGVPISPNDMKFKVNEFDGTVTATLPNADLDDDGKYELEIANDSGSVVAPFKVKVQAPPGAPTGPMVISNVSKNECTLAWKSPENDGGSRITHYAIEKRDTSKGKDAWVPYSDVCKDHSIKVHGLKENNEYEFRVMAVNQYGVSKPLVSSETIVAKLPFDAPDAPGAPDVQEIGSDFVSLQWARPANDGGGPITGYHVDKKEKGSDKWIRCNFSPILSTMFNIPNLIEDREYEFRVIAENEAGCSEPSMGSKSVLVKDPNAATSPTFTMRLEDTSANEGKTAYFECDINASPNTDVRFFKSGREIFSGGRYQITNEGKQIN